MKQVKLTIRGNIMAVSYCSQSLINDEDSYIDSCYYIAGWNELRGMYVDDDWDNDIQRQKGKYVKTREYFHGLMGPGTDHEFPVEIHTREFLGCEADYYIELEDDEEFDPKKLQLVKSDYELSTFPYFIIAEYVMYDGERVFTEDVDDYYPEEKLFNTFTEEQFAND